MAANVVFTPSPAHVDAGQLLDFTTTQGQKVYKQGIRGLSDTKYDLNKPGLMTFLSMFDDCITKMGWESIFSIPDLLAGLPHPNLRMLTTEYSRITMEQIQNHVTAWAGNQDCDKQDSFMAYTCLTNSISEEALAKLNLNRESFVHNGVGNGPLFLKTIILEAHVNMQATVIYLREQLTDLDQYMHDIKYDVIKFNNHAKTVLLGLSQRGESTLDLLANLFKAYTVVPNKEFLEFVQRKRNAYKESKIKLTPNGLMENAKNKYS